ncbi:MAG: amidohydrolase [Bacteriovoracaceae bacterium]|nr:amidohydrolase [Bacteroidota bacterium]
MKNILLILLALIIAASTFMTIASRKRIVDLLIVNANVYTVDASNSRAEAFAIRGSRIVAVGTTQDIQNQYTSQNVIDAQGKTIVPGLIDAHAHVMGLGQSLSELNLYGTESSQQIAEMVAEKVKDMKPGEWIRGRGWDQNDWGKGTRQKPFPSSVMLDKVAPNNPVILNRIDGHAIWVNSAAMQIAKKSTDMPMVIEGGQIVRDRLGNPTGIFIDNAESVIRNIVPEYSTEELKIHYNLAFSECLKLGITSVHDMGIDKKDYALYRELADRQQLPMRIYALIGGSGELLSDMLKTGPYIDKLNSMFTIRSIKLYLDGALGSRGAALIEPYSDEPEHRGLITTSPDSIRLMSEQGLEKGFQIAIHAIGDRGNRIALNEFEKAAQRYPEQAKRARLRIEHAQVIAPDDIQRFKKLHIIPSMQPTHATSDMYWAQARLGPDRVRGAYAWRSLLDDGNIIPSGSDFPVELPNPLHGFYAAVTRQDKVGIPRSAADVAEQFQLSADGIKDSLLFNGGWYIDQRMTREEALRSFTMWGAYAEFMEQEKGSIEAGKLADFVMLAKDIMIVSPKEILTTEVEMTVVGGIVRYRKQ